MKPQILYVDLDDTLCDYADGWSRAKKRFPQNPYPQSQHGFFADLAPLPGAINSIKALHQNPFYDVYILTAPSVFNPMSYTEKRTWVGKHLGLEMAHRLIINPNKGLMRGDILIDDSYGSHGQSQFEGEFIHFGSVQFPHWHAVMTYLNYTGFNGGNGRPNDAGHPRG